MREEEEEQEEEEQEEQEQEEEEQQDEEEEGDEEQEEEETEGKMFGIMRRSIMKIRGKIRRGGDESDEEGGRIGVKERKGAIRRK